LGLDECATKFIEEDIDGKQLMEVEQEDWKVLGLQKLANRKIFRQGLAVLQHSSSY